MNYFRQKYPLVHYTLYSGIADDIKERIENGLLDIAFLTEPWIFPNTALCACRIRKNGAF